MTDRMVAIIRKTRHVCETRMPPGATKSKYGKNL